MRRSPGVAADTCTNSRALSSALFSRRRQVVRRVLGDVMGDKEAALALLEEVEIDQETRVEGLTEANWMALAAARAWTGKE